MPHESEEKQNKKSKQVHATVRPEREDREKHGQRTSAGGDVLLRRG
jgi:hypothetical protein